LNVIKSFVVAAAFVCAASFSTMALAADAVPSANALVLANRLMVDVGIRGSLDVIVPNMLTELQAHVLQTHPEAESAIHDVIFALAPEFGKTEQGAIDAVAASLATHMSEQALTASVAFFDGPDGKEYVRAQPFMLQDMNAALRAWREQISVSMLTRAREELKKKGVDF
jgi:uncharacterized protein